MENLQDETDFEFKPWSCPTCKVSQEKFLGFRGGKYQRYGQGVTTRIMSCRSCHLLYPNPFPIPKNPQKLYGDPVKYFFLHDEVEKIESFKALAEEISRRMGRSEIKLLDVGAGRGELLIAAKKAGIDCLGLEFSEAMISHADKNYGITLVKQSIEEFAKANPQSFDVITLSAILEHVYDPDSMVDSAARLLKSGGLLYIDVPNEPNLLTWLGNLSNRLIWNKGIFNLSPTWSPYHVYGFNPKALTILLKKHGFVIDHFRIQGGTKFPSNGKIMDRMKAFVATQLVHLGNLTGTANNLTVWARKASAF